MKTCKVCHLNKADSEFHTGHRRCKACYNEDQLARRHWEECRWAPPTEWSDTLREYCEHRTVDTVPKALVEALQTYRWYQQGGSDAAMPDDVTVEVLWRSNAKLTQAVQSLEERLNQLEALVKESTATKEVKAAVSSDVDAPRLMRRFTDAYTKLVAPPEVKTAVTKAWDDIVHHRLIDPMTLRSIVTPYEMDGVAMDISLIYIYNSFFASAIEDQRQAANYDEAVDIVSTFTGVNYYEVDWADIPNAGKPEEGEEF